MKQFYAGNLLFVRGHSPISSLIKLFDGEYSHCCVALSSTHIIESQRFVNTRICPVYFEDYDVVDLNLTEEQVDNLIKMSIQMTGHKYDYLQLLGIAIEKIFKFKKEDFMNNKNKYICSEMIDILLYCAGIIDDETYLGDKTPNELYLYVTTKFSKI